MMTNENRKSPYEDIMHLSRPVSRKHPPMDKMMRAAQFAPFAALTGHEDAVKERARLTEEEIELDEYEISVLDRQIRNLIQDPSREVCITYFIPDMRKEGGKYVADRGYVKKIDEYNRQIILQNDDEQITIPISKIIEIMD